MCLNFNPDIPMLKVSGHILTDSLVFKFIRLFKFVYNIKSPLLLFWCTILSHNSKVTQFLREWDYKVDYSWHLSYEERQFQNATQRNKRGILSLRIEADQLKIFKILSWYNSRHCQDQVKHMAPIFFIVTTESQTVMLIGLT